MDEHLGTVLEMKKVLLLSSNKVNEHLGYNLEMESC